MSNAPLSLTKSRTAFAFSSIKNVFSGLFPAKESAPARQPSPVAIQVPKNRFLEAAARVFESKHYSASSSADAPYGFFRGRHIIGDCTRFSTGIFVHHQPQEAVVIDERYGALTSVYNTLLDRIQYCSASKVYAEYEIFNHVTLLASEIIEIKPNKIEEFSRKENLIVDGKISLDVYIIQGFGLAHHQVLLAGYLLEKLAEQKKIAGVVSLDSTLSDTSAASLVLLYTSTSGATLRFAPHERKIADLIH